MDNTGWDSECHSSQLMLHLKDQDQKAHNEFSKCSLSNTLWAVAHSNHSSYMVLTSWYSSLGFMKVNNTFR